MTIFGNINGVSEEEVATFVRVLTEITLQRGGAVGGMLTVHSADHGELRLLLESKIIPQEVFDEVLRALVNVTVN